MFLLSWKCWFIDSSCARAPWPKIKVCFLHLSPIDLPGTPHTLARGVCVCVCGSGLMSWRHKQPTGGVARVELCQVRDGSETLQEMTAGSAYRPRQTLVSLFFSGFLWFASAPPRFAHPCSGASGCCCSTMLQSQLDMSTQVLLHGNLCCAASSKKIPVLLTHLDVLACVSFILGPGSESIPSRDTQEQIRVVKLNPKCVWCWSWVSGTGRAVYSLTLQCLLEASGGCDGVFVDSQCNSLVAADFFPCHWCVCSSDTNFRDNKSEPLVKSFLH